MSAPIVQGWCPGAHKPMMSGDGLVVRVRPVAAEISSEQALGIATAAKEFGNGFIDLTNRANLQIRGVSQDSYPKLMEQLDTLDLLDKDPAIEPKRNIALTPFYASDDLSDRLYQRMLTRLADFPSFPGKFGFAIDCGSTRVLADVPADIRFECSASGLLIVRADGCASGIETTEEMAIDAALDMANWFMGTRSSAIRRMGKLLAEIALPERFQGTEPAKKSDQSRPGVVEDGLAFAVPFGSLAASSLIDLVKGTNVSSVRVTPWHSLWLSDVSAPPVTDLILDPLDPILRVHACAGMPFCPQATVETRKTARQLSGRWPGRLHVSGCAKGCAYPHTAEMTLIGRDNSFDLVTNGAAWDDPRQTALRPEDIIEMDLT